MDGCSPGDGVGPGDLGGWLIAHRRQMDLGECTWLEALGRFDAEQRWAVDGQLSCVDWLRWKLKLGRSTAYEWAGVARELRARPVVADAFREGRVSYSAVRVICRMEDPSPEADRAVVDFAERGTVRQLEMLVRHHQQLVDQERPPPDPDLRRGLRIRPVGEGWSRIEVTLPESEAAEVSAVLDAFVAVDRRAQRSGAGEAGPSAGADDGRDGRDDGAGDGDCGGFSAWAEDATRPPAAGGGSAGADDAGGAGPFGAWVECGDHPTGGAREGAPSARGDDGAGDGGAGGAGGAGDGSARGDDGDGDGADGPAVRPVIGVPDVDERLRPWRASRADALVDLARVALAHADGGHAAGDDRYLLHLVAKDGEITALDGTPIDPATAAVMACDASVVSHTVGEDGEPLHLGRKTKVWSTAQRRAVLVRDAGHCRFPGCDRRLVDVHHRVPYGDGGYTDIDNALTMCRSHHRMLHHGFTTSEGVHGTIHFHRPDGSELGATTPANRQLAMAA